MHLRGVKCMSFECHAREIWTLVCGDENLKTRQFYLTVEEIRKLWCTKMVAAHCTLFALQARK